MNFPLALLVKMRRKTDLLIVLVGLFFLYVIVHSLFPPLPSSQTPLRLYANQCQSDLRLTLLEAIRTAKESIHVVMFGLSDEPILSELAQKTKEGVHVDLYYDLKGSPRLDLLIQGARLHPIEHSGLMHLKILIIDHEMVFIGSANMTTSSLKMHDNLMLGLMDRKAAHFLEKKTPHESGYFKTLLKGQELEIWLLPDLEGLALLDLRKKIKEASRSIRIAQFTYTHPALIEEVIAAHKRGVEVSVVIDMHSSLGASAQAIQRMKQSGAAIFISQGVQLMHHKFLWIDEEMLITGSANWTKSAFDKNNDCLITLPKLDAKQKKLMKKLWKRLSTEARDCH